MVLREDVSCPTSYSSSPVLSILWADGNEFIVQKMGAYNVRALLIMVVVGVEACC